MHGDSSPYARVLLPQLVMRERVIYLDVDLLVMKDLRELWDQPLNGCLALAVPEPGVTLARDCVWLAADDPDRHLPYFNSGLMVLDLAGWRAGNCTAAAMRLIEEHGGQMRFYDQTLLCYLLRGRIGALDASWNVFCVGASDATYLNPDGTVIHLVVRPKPWFCFKNMTGCHLWYLFHDRFVAGLPAGLRFGLWRGAATWPKVKRAIHRLVAGHFGIAPVCEDAEDAHDAARWRMLLGGLLVRTRPTARILLAILSRDSRYAAVTFWLRRWLLYGPPVVHAPGSVRAGTISDR